MQLEDYKAQWQACLDYGFSDMSDLIQRATDKHPLVFGALKALADEGHTGARKQLKEIQLAQRIEAVRRRAGEARDNQAVFLGFSKVFSDLERPSAETAAIMEALAELTAESDSNTKLLLAVYEIELSMLLEFVDSDNSTTRAALEALIQQEAEAWAQYQAQEEAERAKLAAMNEDERAAYKAQQRAELAAWVKQGRKTPPQSP